MQTRLFVQNISTHTSEEQLQELFEKHGEVMSTTIPTDHTSGRPKGFAFVEMLTPKDAKTAMKSLDRKKLNGRVLRIAFSKSRERKRSTAYSYLF